MASPSVIVIGAGFAGIAAARALHDAAFQVYTLDLISSKFYLGMHKDIILEASEFCRSSCLNHVIGSVEE